jgi:NitT/TauT family transport system ATP-binding protein
MTEGNTPLPEIVFRQAAKRYNGKPIVEDINLMIEKGEFVTFLGPSGCGKSTLLKMIAGLAAVSSGEILVNGMTPANAREIVSFIFQDATLLPWRTVERNVELGLELERVAQDRRRRKTKEMLDMVGLGSAAGAFPRELSGGMKMRVSIARALATRPRILLMDEPFAALDEMTRERMNEELLRLQRQQGWTVVFVTHSVAEAVFLSSRIAVLAANPGRILEVIEVAFTDRQRNEMRDSREFEQEVARVSKILRGAQRQ